MALVNDFLTLASSEAGRTICMSFVPVGGDSGSLRVLHLSSSKERKMVSLGHENAKDFVMAGH